MKKKEKAIHGLKALKALQKRNEKLLKDETFKRDCPELYSLVQENCDLLKNLNERIEASLSDRTDNDTGNGNRTV